MKNHTFKRVFPGFPKHLPCLCCDKLRIATWPGDRLHANCKPTDETVDTQPLTVHTLGRDD